MLSADDIVRLMKRNIGMLSDDVISREHAIVQFQCSLAAHCSDILFQSAIITFHLRGYNNWLNRAHGSYITRTSSESIPMFSIMSQMLSAESMPMYSFNIA